MIDEVHVQIAKPVFQKMFFIIEIDDQTSRTVDINTKMSAAGLHEAISEEFR